MPELTTRFDGSPLRNAVYIAIFAALIVVLGLVPPITIPGMLVPVTLQLLGIMFCGSILGAWRGAAAVGLFVALVLLGLPLLSGGRGGFGILFLPNGGYVLGYPVAAFVIGLLTQRLWRRYNFGWALVCNIAGVLVLYVIAIPYAALVTGVSFTASFVVGIPFLPIDLAKAIMASIVAIVVNRQYPLIRPEPAGARRASETT